MTWFYPVADEMAPQAQLSPDGAYVWDGDAWQVVQYSQDHLHVWDGRIWRTAPFGPRAPVSTFRLQTKFLRLLGNLTIKDASGADAYNVRRVSALPPRVSFEDMDGNQLAAIRWTVVTFNPLFKVLRDDKPVVWGRRYYWSKRAWDLQSDTGQLIRIRANLVREEYEMTREGVPLAHISTNTFSIPPHYDVQLIDASDPVLVLACTVILAISEGRGVSLSSGEPVGGSSSPSV